VDYIHVEAFVVVVIGSEIIVPAPIANRDDAGKPLYFKIKLLTWL